MIVQIYKNSTKKCWSVREKRTHKLLFHTHDIVLKDCIFHVSGHGREKVRRTGKKNVHAWIEGTVIPRTDLPTTIPRSVYYDPFRTDTFVDGSNRPIFSSPYCIFSSLLGVGAFFQ